MDGIFGLGFSETIVVIIAIILLIEPKNMVYLKPIIKAAYKAWLSYKRDVESAQAEMEGVKASMMEPIMAAKKEAESEVRTIQEEARDAADKAAKAGKKGMEPVVAAKKEAESGARLIRDEARAAGAVRSGDEAAGGSSGGQIGAPEKGMMKPGGGPGAQETAGVRENEGGATTAKGKKARKPGGDAK